MQANVYPLSPSEEQATRWRARRAAIAASTGEEKRRLLADQARQVRRSVVHMIDSAQMGHIGGDFSVADILTVLFDAVLNVDPLHPGVAGTDRFILSKGHCAASLYTVLAETGFFSPKALGTFMQPLSPLNGHPNRNYVPGIETNTGPLGHGLPVGVGLAIGFRLAGHPQSRVFVVVGDGEMQEGSNWEALMAAAHRGLSNLTVIVDRNRLQQGDRTEATNKLEPLADKLSAFGHEVRRVDGHDHLALLEVLRPVGDGRPVAVIADTIKGKGVSFMEDRVEWHHKVPSTEQVAAALEELA